MSENIQASALPTMATERGADETRKSSIRAAIEKQADTPTREGIMSDVLGIVVVELAQLTVALSQAQTLADVNAAAQPLADLGAAIDAAVKSGALVLPYMVKAGGVQGVLADMTKLSNGVVAALTTTATQAEAITHPASPVMP